VYSIISSLDCVAYRLKARDGTAVGSQTEVKLRGEDSEVETSAGKSPEHNRSPMQSTESLIPPDVHSKGHAGAPDVCEPAVKADRHVSDMATLTVDDMVRYLPSDLLIEYQALPCSLAFQRLMNWESCVVVSCG